jgi:hypothetical protein
VRNRTVLQQIHRYQRAIVSITRLTARKHPKRGNNYQGRVRIMFHASGPVPVQSIDKGHEKSKSDA